MDQRLVDLILNKLDDLDDGQKELKDLLHAHEKNVIIFKWKVYVVAFAIATSSSSIMTYALDWFLKK